MEQKTIFQATDLAYMAALLDSAGASFQMYRGTNRTNKPECIKAYIHVQSSREMLIDWVIDTFGGKKSYVKPRINFMGTRRILKQQWRWVCPTHIIVDFCEQLMPYMKIKTEEMELMIELRKDITGKPNQKKRSRILERMLQIKEERKAKDDQD